MSALPAARPDQPWVDLWLFDLGLQCEPLLEIGAGAKLLDAGEIERSSGLASRSLARSFLASRTALRLTLLEYGCDGNAEFVLGPNGKPMPACGVHFNLSRTRDAVLVAVSNAEVGIDLERDRAIDIAEPVMAAVGAQLRGVDRDAEPAHHPARTWTMMEAWVKYHGYSMRRLLDEEELSSRLLGDIRSRRLDLTPLVLPAGLCGTVCAGRGATLTYRCSNRLLAHGKRSALPAAADGASVHVAPGQWDELCGAR